MAVSDLSQAELTNKLAVFAKWDGPEVPEASLAPFPEIDKTRLYLIDKPGAPQSQIRIGKRA